MSLAKVTSRGQITIPKDVREKLGIGESDMVVVVVDGNRAIMSPVHKTKLADLRGRLPATRPYPGSNKVREEVGRKLARQSDRQAL